MFWWMTNAMQLVTISLRITKYVKIQDSRQLLLKKLISVLGKRQETQIVKFNSNPFTLILQCLSYIVVMNCGPGNALHGTEIRMFWFF